MSEPPPFLTTFDFEVQLSLSGQGALLGDTRGAFSEVSGLEITLEHREIREGGYNLGARQLVGKTSHPVLVFKRGVTIDTGFWRWIQRCLDGTFPLPYTSGEISVYPRARGEWQEDEAAVWAFSGGICTKVKSADLAAAGASAVAIEELHVAHEHLERRR
jgi:phage tail-like protein